MGIVLVTIETSRAIRRTYARRTPVQLTGKALVLAIFVQVKTSLASSTKTSPFFFILIHTNLAIGTSTRIAPGHARFRISIPKSKRMTTQTIPLRVTSFAKIRLTPQTKTTITRLNYKMPILTLSALITPLADQTIVPALFANIDLIVVDNRIIPLHTTLTIPITLTIQTVNQRSSKRGY